MGLANAEARDFDAPVCPRAASSDVSNYELDRSRSALHRPVQMELDPLQPPNRSDALDQPSQPDGAYDRPMGVTAPERNRQGNNPIVVTRLLGIANADIRCCLEAVISPAFSELAGQMPLAITLPPR